MLVSVVHNVPNGQIMIKIVFFYIILKNEEIDYEMNPISVKN